MEAAANQAGKAQTSSGEQDPSMEEILQSIRKIISEDDDGKTPEDETVHGSDVLELTEMVKDDGSVVSLKNQPVLSSEEKPLSPPVTDVLSNIDAALAPKIEAKPAEKPVEKPAPAKEKVVEKVAEKAPEKVIEEPAEKPAPKAAEEPAELTFEKPPEKTKEKPAVASLPEPLPSDIEALLSDEAASAASIAMKHLKQVADPEPPPLSAPSSPGFASGNTVEAMVMQMLKPMMKEWLDKNLPIIVERIVEREVRKLTK